VDAEMIWCNKCVYYMGSFEGISAIHCFGRGKRFCTKPMGVEKFKYKALFKIHNQQEF
jgi:hypothetical protein